MEIGYWHKKVKQNKTQKKEQQSEQILKMLSGCCGRGMGIKRERRKNEKRKALMMMVQAHCT